MRTPKREDSGKAYSNPNRKLKAASQQKSNVQSEYDFDATTGQRTIAIGPQLKVESKSSKKRALTKKGKDKEDSFGVTASGKGNRSLQHQTTFEVQSNRLGYMNSSNHGHHGNRDAYKMSSGIDTKIDWIQLAKAEKTVGGSKLLQEQFIHTNSGSK